MNSEIGGNADDVYLIVNSIGTPTGEGLDFINGQTFLERFYSVFVSALRAEMPPYVYLTARPFSQDTTNKRVGFATTSFTDATTN